MGGPVTDGRGVADRGTGHRISTPPAAAEPQWPAFHEDVLGLLGPSAIAPALAYALKWQLAFVALAGRHQERKEVADKLIKIWHFLKDMEAASPRDADGALLVEDPLQVMARAKVQTELVELPTGESILVTRSREEAPLPVWQPTLFPPELPARVRAHYPARPARVEDIPPFRDAAIRQWILTSVLAPHVEADPAPAPQAAAGPGVVPETFSLNEVEDPFKPGEDDAEKALADAARKMDRAKWTAARLAAFKGRTPAVNAALARLATTTLGDIQRHTGVKFPPAYLDDPLLGHVTVLLYHGVFSFALDKHGEPFDLRFSSEGRGLLDYPILIDEPGERVERRVPADDGVYISVQKQGFGLFRLGDAGIQKLLSGTVGAFTAYGYGASAPSRVHKALQSYVDSFSPQGYVAAVTVPSAYRREEITLARIRERIPQFIDIVTPYLVSDMARRAKYKLENWEDFAAEVTVEAIRELILGKVRSKVRDYLIKKIGKRIVPGVNAVAALYDLAAGGEERMRIRHVIACVLVALKSDSEEDAHIAGKTCAKVLGDEFEDAVIDALVERGKKAASKPRRKSRTRREDDERAERDEARRQQQAIQARQVKEAESAAAPAAGAEPEPAAGGAAGGRQPPPAADAPADKLPRPPTKAELAARKRWEEKQRQHEEAIRQKVEELKKQEAERQRQAANGDPAATGSDASRNKGTAEKGTEDKGTGSPKGAPGGGETGAQASNTGAGPSDSSANAANTGTRRGQVKRTPPPSRAADAAEERGTLDKPRVMPPGPPPEAETLKVKEPGAPEGTHDVRDKPNVRTGRATHEEILRANAEKEGGGFPIDHDAHHNALKRGGREAGEQARDALSQSGVSVDDAANATPARGLPRDARAPLESSSQHWGLHRPEQLEALRRELETVKGDPEATRDILKKHGLDIWEGRRSEPPDFWLGPDPEPPEPKGPKKPKPDKPKG